ncbi:MAG: acyl--CoA ligase [Clostridia bacterium]|nr:acyl--CoA ligase [Clostridia bacterium]
MIQNTQTLYEMLKKACAHNPTGNIYNFLGYQRTYQDFHNDVLKTASYLKTLKIGSGDIVSICLPNIPKALVLFYAVNAIGAQVNFIHPDIPVKDYEHLLLKMKPKVLFILNSFKKQQVAFQSLKIYNHILLVSPNEFMTLHHKILTFPKEIYLKITNQMPYCPKYTNTYKEELLKDYNASAVILFSGGTTGNGKAICLSDKNINTCAIQTGLNRENGEDGDKILAILPIFHGYGLVSCIHTAVVQHGEILLLPYFEDRMFMKMFKKYQPNYITGIPKLFSKMIPLLENKKMDLSFLKGVFSGGSQLSESVRIKFNELLKEGHASIEIREGYGLTELVSACTLMPAQNHKKGSIGKPFPGVEAKIVDYNTKQALPHGEIGQIAFQSEAIMLGYYGLENQPFSSMDEDKWLYTDDLGYMDHEGYLYFVDRIKRMLKISGYEVFPSKIEAMYNEIPGIMNCCLVEYMVEDIEYLKLFLVIDHEKNKNRILEAIGVIHKNNLPKWSIPKSIEIVSEIPQTLFKKNDYRKLTEKNIQ